jgi:biotin carboxylase
VRPRVAVLHHERSFFPLDLFQQVGDAAEILWVVDAQSEDDGAARLLPRLGTVVNIEGLDLDQAASALAAHRPDGIVTFVDDHVEAAAALADRLGLIYHSPAAAHTLVDKRLQRAALANAGIPGPRFWPVPAHPSGDELRQVAASILYPAVLKPAEGSGSRGIRRVTDAAELVRLLEDDAHGVGSVVEQYLDDAPWEDDWAATYLSVESVVSGGRPSHVAITGRFPLAEPFRETGNFIPGLLEPRLHEPVLAMVDASVEALRISNAVIHTEIKLTPEGPMLIEVNGRLGGRPPFVLHDVSTVNLFRAACQVAAGIPVRFEGLAPCFGVGFWLMLQPPMAASRVESVTGLEEVSALTGVDTVNLRRNPGDPVDWREGTDSQVLTVRGRTPDHQALAETIDSIRKKVAIDYDR